MLSEKWKGGPRGRLFHAVIKMRLSAFVLFFLMATPALATSYINPIFQVYFDLNTAVPKEEGMKVLESFLKHFNEHPDRQIIVHGHSDWSGPADFNLDLSRRRAEAVRDILVKRGVPVGALKVEWWGDKRPTVVVPKFGEPIAQNRRVDIWLR